MNWYSGQQTHSLYHTTVFHLIELSFSPLPYDFGTVLYYVIYCFIITKQFFSFVPLFNWLILHWPAFILFLRYLCSPEFLHWEVNITVHDFELVSIKPVTEMVEGYQSPMSWERPSLQLFVCSQQIYDMVKFLTNVSTLVRNGSIDQDVIQMMCMINISLVSDDVDDCDTPCWVNIFNFCALEKLTEPGGW